MTEARRLVVTGASGRLGRPLLAHALAQGWRITALVRNAAALADLAGERLDVVPWELDGTAVDESLLQGADAVVHLAAYIPPDLSDPSFAKECFRINTLGTLELLRACQRAGVQQMVYTSSANAYFPLGNAARETDPLYPSHRSTYYLASKVAGETFCEHYRVSGALPTVTLRLSAVYGPVLSRTSVMSRFLAAAREGSPILVHGTGEYSVDFVHADDVARAVLEVVRRRLAGIFNIASGSTTTTLELACLIAELFGRDRESVMLIPRAGNATDAGFSAIDVQRMTGILGIQPRSLREGLSQIIRDQI